MSNIGIRGLLFDKKYWIKMPMSVVRYCQHIWCPPILRRNCTAGRVHPERNKKENWRRLNLSWLSWWQIGSLVEVEAAKGGLYCRPKLRAVHLSSELSSCHLRGPAVEEKDYNVMYFINRVGITLKRRVVPIL
jgi:hypothetical protein